MRLAAWWALNGYGALARLSRASGVPYPTLHRLANGLRRASYATARRIERATDGAVTADELCAPVDLASEGAPNDTRIEHGDTETH